MGRREEERESDSPFGGIESRRRRGQEERQPSGSGRVIRSVLWALCALWTFTIFALFLTGLGRANGSPQEAAAAAMACAAVLSGYVMCRAIAFITKEAE